jgi:hypothetical protein
MSFPFNSGYNGDTVELILFNNSLALTSGVPTIGKINTLLWTVDYSGGQSDPADHNFNFTASRIMTISTQTGTLTQDGLLLVRAPSDTLSIAGGSTVTFDFGSYQIDVTPLAAGPWTQDWLGTSSHDVEAEFELHQVPEPALMLLLGLGLSVVSLFGWRFKA